VAGAVALPYAAPAELRLDHGQARKAEEFDRKYLGI